MAPRMHAAETSALPLFPLHNVLLPGAAMGLRVFERRYLDLVRESGRNGTSFGVCLILDGTEVGAPATPAAFGTVVRIEDFDVGADGVLVLRLRGTRRFHVQRSRIRDNGLVVGEVNWCEPDSDDELRPEHSLLATVLERMLEQVGGNSPRWGQVCWIKPPGWAGGWPSCCRSPNSSVCRCCSRTTRISG